MKPLIKLIKICEEILKQHFKKDVSLCVSRSLSPPCEHAEDVAVVCEALWPRDATQVVAVS